MMLRGDEQRRKSRLPLIVGVLLLWVAIISVGAGTATESTTVIGVANLDVVFWIVFGLLIVSGLALLLFIRPFERNWSPPERENRAWLVLLLFLVLLLWRPEILNNVMNPPASPAGVQAPVEIVEEEEPVAPAEPVAQATDVILLVVALAAVVGVVYWARRSTTEQFAGAGADALEQVDAELQRAFAEANHELEAESDPRAAVMNAYAVLEAAFRDRGQARMLAETPSEHLDRVMRRLAIDRSAFLQLGTLYEVARFSAQPVTTQDQQHAAASLADARQALESQP